MTTAPDSTVAAEIETQAATPYADGVVFDEAENRMHTIKAVMVATLRSVALDAVRAG